MKQSKEFTFYDPFKSNIMTMADLAILTHMQPVNYEL